MGEKHVMAGRKTQAKKKEGMTEQEYKDYQSQIAVKQWMNIPAEERSRIMSERRRMGIRRVDSLNKKV
jgi:hypothetical protein